MNSKMQSYINSLFSGVPRTRQAQDLRDELLGNMQERYEDYLREGKTESQAYSLTVASMGDIDELIAEVMPNDEFRREAQEYRTRKARNTAIAVAMYILGPAIIVGASTMEGDHAQTQSVVLMLVLAAIATALLIYTHMSTPLAYKDFDAEERREHEFERTRGRKIMNGLSSIYWTIIASTYFLISFLAHAWRISWLIWPVAWILLEILEIIFKLGNYHE